jgi:hypothetical protein
MQIQAQMEAPQLSSAPEADTTTTTTLLVSYPPKTNPVALVKQTPQIPPSSSPDAAVSFINNRQVVPGDHRRPLTGSKGKGKERAKPKWAKTEAEVEADLEDETDELLDFTQHLDFDGFIDGLEEETQRSATEEAIERLPTDPQLHSSHSDAAHDSDSAVKVEESKEADTSASTIDSFTVTPRPLTQSRPVTSTRPLTSRPSSSPSRTDAAVVSPTVDAASASPSAPSSSLASSLLQSQPHLRAIHSAHSLRALIDSARAKSAAVTMSVEDGFVPAINSCSVAIPEPRVAVLRERVACNAKLDPSHLPYLHRHPAV